MTLSIVPPSCAVVVGASGGIGRALVSHLVRKAGFEVVHVLSRSGTDLGPGTRAGTLDITNEASIAATAARIGAAGIPVGLTIVATGLLHGPELRPEKAWRELDADRLAESFRVNAIGPALVAKHLLPLMPRGGKAVFAALSARVGSIGDNRLGGWYGYRASKAALNQLIRTLAVELARSRPDAICIGLHPGTVDTGLSRPFQAGVPAEHLFTPDDAADRLLEVIEAATPRDSGAVLAWDGSTVSP
ncbi:SDR family NAD(P)-dependent oxidoreductase [uncultured Enterovirga sp.]|uniref:SDR family NAD(P)-dependent oxidoreductase n=1 Tax=uncultured Enterovirga sp. TaxID=2026352 RepID=UPI0035CADF91